MHGWDIGFNDGVELDAGEAGRAAPVKYILAEGAADALALAGWVDKE